MDTFCEFYRPISTSRMDTPETVDQVVNNNAVYDELCMEGR